MFVSLRSERQLLSMNYQLLLHPKQEIAWLGYGEERIKKRDYSTTTKKCQQYDDESIKQDFERIL